MKTKKVVQKYINDGQWSNAEMAELLCERLELERPITRQTVSSWATGTSDPKTDFLVLMLVKYRDWRFDFALECLSAKDPEIWGHDGKFWNVNKRAKERGHVAAF